MAVIEEIFVTEAEASKSLTFTLDNFEGPLDLLLHLIRENKLDILEIQISELLQQYMEYLDKVRENDLEIAVEFVEMASRLVRIKTNMMLPRPDEEDETLKNLTVDLIEYSLCKAIAEKLKERNIGFLRHVRKPSLINFDNTYLLNHEPNELANAYFSATRRGKRKEKPTTKAFEAIVHRRFVSVESRAIYMLKRLVKTGKISLSQLYGDAEDRSELVATFLAVLELIKTKRIGLNDDNDSAVLLKSGKRSAQRAEEISKGIITEDGTN